MQAVLVAFDIESLTGAPPCDHPSLPYERILREWDELGYDQSVMDLLFHANAERVLGL